MGIVTFLTSPVWDKRTLINKTNGKKETRRDMYKIKEAIIVEGVYDKNRLSSFIDGIILTTHGFAVYSSPDFVKTIERLAKETGIVILTDSDSAGMRIRNFVKQKAADGTVKHAYIPDIKGVEKRKRKASAEGLLGVEGMSEDIIIGALLSAGCTIDGKEPDFEDGQITKADLYFLGLTGKNDSRHLRAELSEKLGIPAKLSSNMLLDVLNRLTNYDELVEIIQKINSKNI
jgi:ribonuclease M5